MGYIWGVGSSTIQYILLGFLTFSRVYDIPCEFCGFLSMSKRFRPDNDKIDCDSLIYKCICLYVQKSKIFILFLKKYAAYTFGS